AFPRIMTASSRERQPTTGRISASAAFGLASPLARTLQVTFPRKSFPCSHKAVLEACDALDGVKDGVLENPKHCRFDPKVLQCKDTDGPTCLTSAQVEAARKIYSGPKNPRTGEQIFPGLEPGSEPNWTFFVGGREPPVVASHFKYVVFKNP